METVLLFVYGTLRPTFGHPLGLELEREAKNRGRASVRGRLLDRGEYPVAIPDPRSGLQIHGELYELPAGHRLWALMDEYEDYKPGASEESLFEREAVEVSNGLGEKCHAQIYWFRGPVTGLPTIEGGDYLDYSRA